MINKNIAAPINTKLTHRDVIQTINFILDLWQAGLYLVMGLPILAMAKATEAFTGVSVSEKIFGKQHKWIGDIVELGIGIYPEFPKIVTIKNQ